MEYSHQWEIISLSTGTNGNYKISQLLIKTSEKIYHLLIINFQVRRIVATLIAVAYSRITKKDVYEMLTIPSKYSWNSRIAVVPPYGLYLCKVNYDPNDLKFENNLNVDKRKEDLEE